MDARRHLSKKYPPSSASRSLSHEWFCAALLLKITKAPGSDGQQAFIAVCFWPPLVDLDGHHPTDQGSLFLCPESPFSSIGRRDQFLCCRSFLVRSSKGYYIPAVPAYPAERKRLLSSESGLASRRWFSAAWWNTLARQLLKLDSALDEFAATRAFFSWSRDQDVRPPKLAHL